MPDYTKLAISYIRFSNKLQERGDSIRRQSIAFDELCRDNDLIPDDSLAMSDFGKSAYHGVHITQGAFGVFLAALRDGKIPARSTLVVEKLDRMGRLHPMDMLPILNQILSSG